MRAGAEGCKGGDALGGVREDVWWRDVGRETSSDDIVGSQAAKGAQARANERQARKREGFTTPQNDEPLPVACLNEDVRRPT